MEPVTFRTPAELRAWLDANHASAPELVVLFHKVGSGAPSVTWPESVDEALRVGWIDGIRRRVDDRSYTIRFTPRRPGSHWSLVNVRRVAELDAGGGMTEAGLRAFAARRDDRTGNASHERARDAELEPDEQALLEADGAAWAWLAAAAPSYRRAALHWVVSAKRPETRARRLAALVADSAAGRRLPHLTPRRG